MADQYVQYPLSADRQQIADRAIAQMEARLPGWEASPASVETILIEVLADEVATEVEVATDVPRAIFRAWGPLVGVPPREALRATAHTTWTAANPAGYTIAAGTQAELAVTGSEGIGWEVAATVVIPPGQTSTAAGAVQLVALEPGEGANGHAGTMSPVEALAWVDSITIVGTTGGGQAAEADDAYLARLSRELELIAPRPILPDDFAVLAARVAGVRRAVAIDGLDPSSGTTGHERMVTVAVADEDGQACAGPVKTAVDDLLQSMREVSFVVWVVDPTHTTVNVSFSARAWPGWDPTDVQIRAIQAVRDHLDPARWGMPPTGDDAAHGGWRHLPVVRYLEVAAALDRVEGLDHIVALTLGGGTADISLPGIAPLPQPGTITGSVT